MSKITSIKQQKNKNRVNVYLDEEFGFGIDLDDFVILNLKIGQELTRKEIDKIVNKAELQKTFNKILRFAMVRARSEKEYRDWLYKKKVPEMIWKDLFSKLKNLELMDDEKFTRFWVESRKDFKPKPERILRQELRLKGVDKEIVNKVLSESEIDEEKIASNLLESRRSHWERVEKTKKVQKMTAYLISKGFDYEVARNAIKRYTMQEDDKAKD